MSEIISPRLADFIRARFDYLATQKSLSEPQKLFFAIAELWLNAPDKMDGQKWRDLKVLAKAEQATVKAENAKIAARKIVSAENEKARKQRTHNMLNAAGLMGLAGLLDKKTGKPLASNEQMLGALIELANRQPSDSEKAHWAEVGAAALAAAKTQKQS